MNDNKSIDFVQESPFITIVFKLDVEHQWFRLFNYSRRAGEFFGFTKELDSKFMDPNDFWRQHFHPDDIEELIEKAIEVVSNPKESVSFTCRGKKKDGQYQSLAGFVRCAIVDGDVYAFVNFYNLQDLEMLNQEFYTHAIPDQLILKEVLETTAFPIYWTDTELRFLGVNREFMRYFKLPNAKKLLGHTIGEMKLFPPQGVEQIVSNQKRILENGEIVSGVTSFIHRGKKHYISYVESPMKQNGITVGLVGSFHDITMQRKIEAKLRTIADLDYLTNIPNRRYFFSQLKDYLQSQEEFAIIMFDLDHFKEINDNLGHETGDTVLQEVATKLEQVVSENGFLARYGGDEFIAIIDSSNEKELEKITLAARKVVQKVDCYNKKVTHLDVSYGYSFYHESSSGDKLVDLADMRMYENKKSKRTS